jgi:UDP-N-acetylmuramate dehydrogenase
VTSGAGKVAPWRDRVVSAIGDMARIDEPLAGRVAFRIGGQADVYARILTIEALRDVLRIAADFGVPVTLLGTGSNVLVSDRGVRGIVVRLGGELADIHLSPREGGGGDAEVGAGALNAQLVALALNLGLVGIEFLATVPGTFGGALIMNAGAHGGEIAPFVREVRLIDRRFEIVRRPGAECGFAYRTSGFASGEILTSATIAIPSGDAAAAREHLKEMRERRRKTQPLDKPNAGSIFKNPPGDYAGRLIEACGLKGRRIGGAAISELHANFIVNEGGAKAADVVALARIAQETVGGRFGVRLEWEVRRIGEWSEEEMSSAATPSTTS